MFFVTAANRSNNSLDANDSIDCCQRCCNVVFDVLLDHIKVLRDNVEFQSIWIRFLGTLSANAHATNKGQQIHEEMVEMLESLLRLLRLPKMVPQPEPTAGTEASAPASGTTKPPVAVTPVTKPSAPPAPQSSGGGWFSWLVGESAPAPPLESTQSSGGTAASATPSRSVMVIVDEDPQLNDGLLIMSSWKAVTSQYPAFANTMKIKNPKLLSNLVMFMEASQHNTRTRSARATSAEEVKAAPIVANKLEQSVAVSAAQALTVAQTPNSASASSHALMVSTVVGVSTPKSSVKVQTV